MIDKLIQGGKNMKTLRFSTEKIIGILNEAAADLPAKELCCKHGMSDATPGMAISGARHLDDLEDERRCFKKLEADQALNIQLLKKITTKEW
jgi:putative transposase